VALSSPELWRDICFKNKENLLDLVQRFQDSLASMVDALKRNDSEELEALFEKAQRLRGKLL